MTTFTLNGKLHNIDGPEDMPLLGAIRDLAGLKGTKFGCGAGLCGACTVHLNGEAVRSCQTSLADAANGKVTTIEFVGSTQVPTRPDHVSHSPACGKRYTKRATDYRSHVRQHLSLRNLCPHSPGNRTCGKELD